MINQFSKHYSPHISLLTITNLTSTISQPRGCRGATLDQPLRDVPPWPRTVVPGRRRDRRRPQLIPAVLSIVGTASGTARPSWLTMNHGWQQWMATMGNNEEWWMERWQP